MNKEKYYMEVIPEFLIDEYEKFSCDYTIWVYVELKFKYQFYLQKSPYKTFKIDVKTLADKYVTTTATIYKAINELTGAGLLVENKRNFRIVNESEYPKRYKIINPESNKNYPQYIILNKKAYNDLLSDIKDEVLPMGNHMKFIVKCLKLYYYHMIYDRHCVVFKDEPILESSLTQTSIERKLGIDHRNVKKLLKVLNDCGYIKFEDSKIFTLNKETYDPSNYTVNNHEEENTESYDSEYYAPSVIEKPFQNSTAQEDVKTVPDAFIGYKKSDDGKVIFIIFYSKKIKSITIKQWCKGDGIRPTTEEFDIGNELFGMGKRSKYFKPENYWLYKQDIESLKKAA